MNSDEDTRYRVGCPIRRSRDHRSLASPPGFSQRATSFIASQCQGIHQMPFFALDHRRNIVPPHKTAAHRGKTQSPRSRRNGVAPDTATSHSHEDTSPDRHWPSRARAYPPRSHYKLSLYPSNNIPPRVIPGGYLPCSSPNVGWPPAHGPGGGGERDRTDDLLLAKQALSQLSYTPDQKSEVRIQRSAPY
jgi:hypothetical protein